MSIKDIIYKVSVLIAKPEQWSPCCLARRADGSPCYTGDPDRAKLSLLGAVFAAGAAGADIDVTLNLIRNKLPDPSAGIYSFEAKATHEEVLNLLHSIISELYSGWRFRHPLHGFS